MSLGNEGEPAPLRHNQHLASNVADGGRHRRFDRTGPSYPIDLHLLLRNGLPETHKFDAGKHRFQAGPQYYRSVPDTLYRNNGDGTFTDVSGPSAIGAHAGPGMGMVCADSDDDGDGDVFVCHDGAANFLFQNDGHGRFEEVGLFAGVAYDFYGKENSSMGVDCGDYDDDGRLDLFMTDYHAEMPVLYRNLGDSLFEDATSAARMSNDLFPHVNWGTGFDDLDNDGDIDAVVLNSHAPPTILRNESQTGHHWLQVRLEGVTSNRDGIGSRVCVVAGDLVQVAEVHSGREYQSHFGTRLHFGLADRDRVDQIEVRWLGGEEEVFPGADADQLIVLKEGSTEPDE